MGAASPLSVVAVMDTRQDIRDIAGENPTRIARTASRASRPL